MSGDRAIPVARTEEIPPGGRKLVNLPGRKIAVFNVGGEYFALNDRCPHEGGSLCRGDQIGLVQSSGPGDYQYSRANEMVRCPWHGWEFDLRTGQSWCDPKRMRVKTFHVTVESGAELEPGPYVAETFEVSVVDDYVVLHI